MLFHIFFSWIVAYPKNFIGECIQNLVHDGRSFPAVLVSRRGEGETGREGEGEILTGELFLPASARAYFQTSRYCRKSSTIPLFKVGSFDSLLERR